MTLTQVGPSTTRIQIRTRCEILKPVLFLQSKIVAESERGTKDIYSRLFTPFIGDLANLCQEEMDRTLREKMRSEVKKVGNSRIQQARHESFSPIQSQPSGTQRSSNA